jgi:hypothetical protein
MKSMSFQHLRPNPVQEVPVSNFHRALDEFVAAPPKEEKAAVAARKPKSDAGPSVDAAK